MKKKLVVMLIAIAGSFGILSAQEPAVMIDAKPGWHKIGELTVDFKKDRDELLVLGNDRFSSIKFKVMDAPVELLDLEVYFENDTKQDIAVRSPINAGGESRVIDLNGDMPALKKIVFLYKTLPNRAEEKATLEIYGMKRVTSSDMVDADGDRAKDAERERMERERKAGDKNRMDDRNNANNDRMKNPDNHIHETSMEAKKGWYKIGESTADLTKGRDVIIPITTERTNAIKFFVTGADLEIMDLEIYFANGPKQDVKVRNMIKAGGETRVIDLTGEERAIKQIVFLYKTAPNNNKAARAHVEVWGRRKINDKKGDMHNDNNDHANTHSNGGIAKPAIEMNDKAGWHRIATTSVTFNKERDEVAILGADRFAKLKFKVKDAGIEISDMTVMYQDGTKQDVPVKSIFKEGMESRVIDVPGPEKDIAKIAFVYKTIPNQGKDKANVEIWGMKTNLGKAKDK